MEQEITVVEYPAKRMTGVGIRSSMKSAAEDGAALWERLAAPVAAILGPHKYDAYGVSIDFAEDGSFTYWATLDVPFDMLHEPSGLGGWPDVPTIPLRIDGLTTIDLRAGSYAATTVPELVALPAAYSRLYDAWPKAQSRYAINFGAPCFELYPAAWREGNPFRLFVPVRKLSI